MEPLTPTEYAIGTYESVKMGKKVQSMLLAMLRQSIWLL